MRDIKFRAWYEDEMIYSDCAIGEYDFTFDEEGKMIFNVWNDELHKLTPDGDITYSGWDLYTQDIMQFTGLKDKNGVEIYKGDIVRYIDNPTGISSGISKVIFENGFIGIETDMSIPLYSIDAYWLEIIGNVYENPELLKKDA